MWETNKKIQKELRWYICVTVFFFFLPSFSPLLCQQPLRCLLDVALEW